MRKKLNVIFTQVEEVKAIVKVTKYCSLEDKFIFFMPSCLCMK